VSIAIRALVMLAVVLPVFAATAMRPAWWQVLLAAAVGAALGRLAVHATRGRRAAPWVVAAVAATMGVLSVAWSFGFRFTPRQPHDRAGTPLLVVRSNDGGASLTWDDVHAIEARGAAAPSLQTSAMLTNGEQNWNTQVVGTTPAYFDLRGLRLAAGDRFDATGVAKPVVVLGDTVVARLYSDPRPVGQLVRIKNMPFTIVGVLAHRGHSSQGQDYDDVALVPIDIFVARVHMESKLRFGGTVLVAASAGAEADVRSLLRDRHRLAPGDDDDFVLRTVIPE
jgi:putative ABC transport system permease protein